MGLLCAPKDIKDPCLTTKNGSSVAEEYLPLSRIIALIASFPKVFSAEHLTFRIIINIHLKKGPEVENVSEMPVEKCHAQNI